MTCTPDQSLSAMVTNGIPINEARVVLDREGERRGPTFDESILGEENLNICSTSVIGSTTQRKQAVMVIGVDGKPSNEALKKIDKIPAVEEFVFLVL
nr:ACT domain-containing protein [Tanacetum cinerariifolium]